MQQGSEVSRLHISTAVDWTAQRDSAMLMEVESGAQLGQRFRRAEHLRDRECRADAPRDTEYRPSPRLIQARVAEEICRGR